MEKGTTRAYDRDMYVLSDAHITGSSVVSRPQEDGTSVAGPLRFSGALSYSISWIRENTTHSHIQSSRGNTVSLASVAGLPYAEQGANIRQYAVFFDDDEGGEADLDAWVVTERTTAKPTAPFTT
ncbi:hypothetical protein POSPLADRAFT_1057881 [Postia placenta MAD-698-R-SB12]|uniref:Uncharacterized protein n=1 Tax=Postia placenta MAD-698-R-SB12 TaxID=670580 RepID=A0A1X6MX39_9APHY|nr:hypothetical protein POSPLADRAFT_1057881 [Postia placenta MAD-698-R-SB12]OSX60935.1 hypothetical protein POSPLADRAFT_1057881 [Postia placenta MAD-698-R-SB12]